MRDVRGSQQRSRDGGSEPEEPSVEEAAEYLVEVLPELSALAERSGLTVVAYFLEMARAEVEESTDETDERN